MANKGKTIERIKPLNRRRLRRGDVITADLLNDMGAAIARNTQAIQKPQQKDISAGETGGESSTGAEYSAGASDITSETVTITDDGGNDHDIERITKIVFTNDVDGSTLTLNISYT